MLVMLSVALLNVVAPFVVVGINKSMDVADAEIMMSHLAEHKCTTI